MAAAGCGDPGPGTVVSATNGQTGDGDGRSAGDGDGNGHGFDGPGGESDGPDACARADLSGARVIPTVWLLVDGSGSMATPMGGTMGGDSRWTVLRNALLDDSDGIIAALQESVAFGLYVYDGGLSPPGIKTDLCPRVIKVAPTTNNLSSIRSAYPEWQPGASTPTHYALLQLSDLIKSTGSKGPTYVVLATDGKPNLCDFHDGVAESEATERQAVMTVAELAQAGIKTFAISMAEGDAALAAHLADVAKAGGTNEPVFTPTTSDGLTKALSKILEGTMTCDVALQGKIVEGHECQGEVTLNGEVLTCGEGFRVKKDLSTLELLGTACDTLLHDPSAALKANFPCDYVELF